MALGSGFLCPPSRIDLLRDPLFSSLPLLVGLLTFKYHPFERKKAGQKQMGALLRCFTVCAIWFAGFNKGKSIDPVRRSCCAVFGIFCC